MSPARSAVRGPVSSAQFAPVQRLVEQAMAAGTFPGAVVYVRQDARVVWHHAFGWAAVTPRRRTMRSDAVFDLASLTKPIATATAVLQLVEHGILQLDHPVADYLPAFGASGKQAVTVRHLLTHTSGLPAWIRLYLRVRTPAEALRYICALSPGAAPGSRVEYSDLGFIVLGELVRACGELSLDRYLDARIAPLVGWRRTRFRPPAGWRPRCVATEAGNEFERAAAGAEGKGFRWRTGVICGEVHDGNSYYLYRGVAGHAGLFSTAEEVGRFGQIMLDFGATPHGAVLGRRTVAEATRDQTGQLEEARGLGWRCRRGSPFMGVRASSEAFGHTGFTGTSLLVDPPRALVVVLLTNRVHPRAATTAIETFRAQFHDAVIEAIES
ncbi:MAG: beta-lactamase family protein [Bacillati bacterium ANGP1]|uniref:Beta-lactamase family protein n=1 Tax=Candidatus Segetimicrobium genomatis TaxID=2569760 RepID=A0A537LWD9_9BACT|nr:MAG: beta-lactamase family protein [Terrabacteria group bacterium ANGP1]